MAKTVESFPPLKQEVKSDPTPGLSFVEPQAAAPLAQPLAGPADFFMAGLSAAEQQHFLDFCTMRQLSPEAGVLAFLKEKLQQGDLDAIRQNPFTDEAQAVVEQLLGRQQGGQPVPYQMGKKVTKPCEVCQEPVVIDFPGRLLCQNPKCWHAYAGFTPQQSSNTPVVGGSAIERRLGKMESLVERLAGMMDRFIGGGENRAA